MTDETHDDAPATVSPAPAVTTAPTVAATVEPKWFDLGVVEATGRHYESLTGQSFAATEGDRRQVQFARDVDVSGITDAASAEALVAQVGRGKLTFRYIA